jgi:hypothetical protein
MFNTFFTSLSSVSFSSEDDSDFFINKTFLSMKNKKHLNLSNKEKFKFTHVNPGVVESLIKNLSDTSGPGLSVLPSKLIKFCCGKFVPILTRIFNHCIDIGKLPIEWKSALVTPLYKNKGPKSDFNNYRGISVLPPIAKIFEKILAKQITIYLSINNILFKGQHGFRNGHSCETALHELLSDLNVNRDKRLISLLLFIDFRKAFDLVDSRKLLLKLFHYGFDNNALKLIGNYFSDRFQTVKYDRNLSPPMTIILGVPQGSILGPLFFLIFINDLAFVVELLCKMFADDTTLYDADSDLEVLINRFKKQLEPLIDWCNFNRLDLNWSKTFFMFVSNKRQKLPKEIYVGEISVKVVDSFKLLGVTIDNKLNFDLHCTLTKRIINRKLYSIKRLFYLATTVKIQFFKTFILPYFDYCASLMLYFPKSTIQRFNNCFNLCLYKLFGFKPDSNDLHKDSFFDDYEQQEELILESFSNKLHKYGLCTFQERLIKRFLIFAHNILNNVSSPPELKSTINLSDSSIDDPIAGITRFNLRGRAPIKNNVPNTKYDHLTFRYFFPKLITKFDLFLDLKAKPDKFKILIDVHLTQVRKVFLDTFVKFNVSCITWRKKAKVSKKRR